MHSRLSSRHLALTLSLASALLLVGISHVPIARASTAVPTCSEVFAGLAVIDGVYQVSGANDLYCIGEGAVLDVNDDPINSLLQSYKQTRDIDIATELTVDTEWRPIGNGDPFLGQYDGDGYAISNLYFDGSGNSGLFGIVGDYDREGTLLKGVNLVGAEISGNDWNVGGLVGVAIFVDIESSNIEASVSGLKGQVGGLVGYSDTVSIRDSTFTGSVAGQVYGMGGFVGLSGNSLSVVDSQSSAEVRGQRLVGGLVGFTAYETSIRSTVVQGSVIGGEIAGPFRAYGRIGGLVGEAQDGPLSIDESAFAGDIRSEGPRVGGLVGVFSSGAEASIESSYAVSTLEGTSDLGGLVGRTEGALHLSDVYAAGVVTEISGDVTAPNDGGIGGLVGTMNVAGTVTRSYSTSSVNFVGTSPPAHTGGLIGGSLGSFDGESFTSNTTLLAVGIESASSENAVRSSPELMRKLETYQSWNVSDTRIVEVWLANPGTEVWGICSTVNDGFPFLQWQFDDAPAESCGLAVDPPEWTIIRQGLPMPSTNSCDDVADSRFAYGTGLRGEWGRSWEPWVDSGDPAVAGGWACVRVIVNKGGVKWMIENSLL